MWVMFGLHERCDVSAYELRNIERMHVLCMKYQYGMVTVVKGTNDRISPLNNSFSC